MTRFIFISDTHLGAAPMNFQEQNGYPECIQEITGALNQYIIEQNDIDFVLHGGDMIDFTNDENILKAREVFKFSIPTYLCLGNHDLTTQNALERWITLAPQYFINNKPNYTLRHKDLVIHIAPNHWNEKPYFWSNSQNPHLSDDQISKLKDELNTGTHLPHLLSTHSPIYGIPKEQSGIPIDYHTPCKTFTSEINALVDQHSNIKCVLSGHNHINTHTHHEGVEYISASSFVETPFEFKLFEATANSITMRTISLKDSLQFTHNYNEKKTYVQGRDVDRFFKMDLE